MRIKSFFQATAWMLLATMTASAVAQVDVDPPGRVARLSYIQGEVSFQPAGESNWLQAQLNRPLGTGDDLYTDRNSRLELDVGDAAIRLDQQSTANLLNLNDQIAQIELTGGTLNLRVRRIYPGQSYEIDTPTLAFVANRVGEYRIDVAPDGASTMVTVFDGSGDVYGENNASYSVQSGNSYRFNDASLRNYEVLNLPRPDDFDNWTASRNGSYDNSQSRQYVSSDVIGYQDLDTYGRWDTVSNYGSVWFPSSVSAGWAPYRDGHWAWIEPYGWTWIDRNPWGFAPFHYGRWAYVGNRWGWCPGPLNVRPIYAPALVGFVGGGGWGLGISTGPVGWFPLGRRDVYVPWYNVSRDYFRRVNVYNSTVINNVNITNIYNNYSNGRPIDANYAYRNNAVAVTAVSRATFVNARSVSSGRVKVDRSQLANAHVVSRLGIAPTAASIASPAARRARTAAPSRTVVDRRVIARSAPPARVAPLASRIQAIERNGGRALPVARTRVDKPTAAVAANRRIQVVGNGRSTPKPLPTRSDAAGTRSAPANRGEARTPAARSTPTNPPSRSAPAPRESSNRAVQPSRNPQAKPAERALPSSRYAPQGNAAPTNRAATPSRSAPTRTTNPADRTQPTPSSRYSPRDTNPPPRSEPRSTGAPRTTPTARTTRPTPPTTREATPVPRESPVRQAAPVQQREPIQRTQPAQRPATPMSHEAPAQRMAPAPRSAPVPRQPVQPQPAMREPVPQVQPQRTEPQPATRPAKRKPHSSDDDDHGQH